MSWMILVVRLRVALRTLRPNRGWSLAFVFGYCLQGMGFLQFRATYGGPGWGPSRSLMTYLVVSQN